MMNANQLMRKTILKRKKKSVHLQASKNSIILDYKKMLDFQLYQNRGNIKGKVIENN